MEQENERLLEYLKEKNGEDGTGANKEEKQSAEAKEGTEKTEEERGSAAKRKRPEVKVEEKPSAASGSAGPSSSREENKPRSKGGVPMLEDEKKGDKRKAEGDVGGEAKESKVVVLEKEQKGEKRSLGEWEEMAERFKENAAKRARDTEARKVGEDVRMAEIMAVLREIAGSLRR